MFGQLLPPVQTADADISQRIILPPNQNDQQTEIGRLRRELEYLKSQLVICKASLDEANAKSARLLKRLQTNDTLARPLSGVDVSHNKAANAVQTEPEQEPLHAISELPKIQLSRLSS